MKIPLVHEGTPGSLVFQPMNQMSIFKAVWSPYGGFRNTGSFLFTSPEGHRHCGMAAEMRWVFPLTPNQEAPWGLSLQRGVVNQRAWVVFCKPYILTDAAHLFFLPMCLHAWASLYAITILYTFQPTVYIMFRFLFILLLHMRTAWSWAYSYAVLWRSSLESTGLCMSSVLYNVWSFHYLSKPWII